MKKDDFIILIPARYGSSRFPGKALADLGGTPLIVEVCRNASRTGVRIVVATDHPLIFKTVKAAGFEAVMTSEKLDSGTDRIIEALNIIGGNERFVVNVQGDEPEVDAGELLEAMKRLEEENGRGVEILTFYYRTRKAEEARDLNRVKAVASESADALYFSRLPIPFVRTDDGNDVPEGGWMIHKGIYLFTRGALDKISRLTPSSLEKAEKLEQLRWLENGMRIGLMESHESAHGIDTPEDLKYFIERSCSEEKRRSYGAV